MSTPNTTRASLDFALQPFIGQLDVAWRMPKLFETLGGRTVLERVNPVMTGAGKRKHFEWSIEFTAPFSPAAGGGIGWDNTESGDSGVLYPKIISAIAEIDPSLMNTESGVQGMVDEATRKIKNIRDHQLPTIGMHHFWLDGSGRRARVHSIANEGSYTKVILKPIWAQDAAPGALDAAKFIEQNMYVDLGTADETANSGEGSFTRAAAWGVELRVLSKHTGTTIHSGADPSYIIVSPQVVVPQETDVTTMYVYITHPLGTLNGEPQGYARYIGNGYNGRTSGIASEVNAAWPAFGWQRYATIDRQNVDYEKFIGFIYNSVLATPCAEVQLTPDVIDNWLGEFYDRASADTDLDVVVANVHLRPAFAHAFADQGTLYLNNSEIKNIGWAGATIYDPYGAGGARWKPVIFARDAHRQSITGFSWKHFKQAVTSEFAFSPGTYSEYWTDMRPIDKSRMLRATGEQEGFLIQLRPQAQTSVWFVDETPA
jgi:hypothetical protein